MEVRVRFPGKTELDRLMKFLLKTNDGREKA